MATQYFFLALKPTKSGLAYIISKSFAISYIDSLELSSKQRKKEVEFREFNNDPDFYNSDWSSGYFDVESANNERQSVINNLETSGSIVRKPNWPS